MMHIILLYLLLFMIILILKNINILNIVKHHIIKVCSLLNLLGMPLLGLLGYTILTGYYLDNI